MNTCDHPTLVELREGRRSLGVVEATTLRSSSFERQAKSRKIHLPNLI
jgi:hypothetical protein